MLKIVESIRVGEKIIQHVVSTVGVATNREELITLDQVAKARMLELQNERNPALPGFESVVHSSEPKECKDVVSLGDIREIKRINVGVEDIFGELYAQMDFSDLITGTRKDGDWNEILKKVVLARLFEPESKRRTSNDVLKDMNEEIPLEKIYRMMDRLIPLEEEIKKRVFQSSMSLLDYEVDVLFFDVTTLYFESFEPDDLRAFGFSKDCKFKETQIVLALVMNNQGVPLTYEIFPGNQSEGKTLVSIVQKMKESHCVRNVVMVADRAMFSEENLCLLESEGVKYIVAAKLKTLKKEVSKQFLNSNECPLSGWIKEVPHASRRLVVSYSVERAKKDYKHRKRLIDRLLKKATDGKIPFKSLMNNNGTKKYIEVTQGKATVNEEKIHSDSLWDGIHGVITNYSTEEKTAQEILERYKGLWKIEEVFRINKHHLKMRPIYHWKPGRIRAHILICFMAYVMLNTTKLILEKNKINLSVSELRKEISKREVSIIRDRFTQRKYFVPGSFSEKQKQIYKAFKLPVSESVKPLFKTRVDRV